MELLDEEDPVVLHGYTNSNSGYADVRQTVADSLNRRFGTSFAGKNIIMTVGAAGGLNVILKTLLNPGDEVITFAPYFGEYRSYTNNYDGRAGGDLPGYRDLPAQTGRVPGKDHPEDKGGSS